MARTRFQPLVDSFGRTHDYLRISITDRCNLRCAYCAPTGGEQRTRRGILSFEEIVRVAAICAEMGVRKIRLTGGEPTVRQDVGQLILSLSRLAGVEHVAMTTNGVLLERMAPALKAAGLSSINVSLDTLRRDRFEEITGRDRLGDVLAGVDAAIRAGLAPVKLNVVAMRGVNDDELLDFVQLARDRPVSVRFIEYMPFGGNGWDARKLVPAPAIMALLRPRYRLVRKPGRRDAVARCYRLHGFAGTIGFITPVSDPFCGRCTRLRLTADGAIRPCLLHPAEVGLRHALRNGCSDGELAGLVRSALLLKCSRPPMVRAQPSFRGRSMLEIGG